MKVALTVAGSDPVGGAGIQADLKTFAAFGVYGLSALTAVTAQNTHGISGILGLQANTVRLQIEELWDDVAPDAVKTGMLADGAIVAAVADVFAYRKPAHLVVDPVMTATAAGLGTLLEHDAVSILRSRLLPLARVVTPNVDEAAALTGLRVNSIAEAKDAARRIADLGPRAVVVKGGHLEGTEAVDILYYEGTFAELSGPRFGGGTVHGTGCTFASAIAAALALGDDVPSAVSRAKRYISGAIQQAVPIGHGARVLDHFWEARAGRGLYS